MIKKLSRNWSYYLMVAILFGFGLFFLLWIIHSNTRKDFGEGCILLTFLVLYVWKMIKIGYLSYDDEQVYIRKLIKTYSVPYADITKLDLRIGWSFNSWTKEYGYTISFQVNPAQVKSIIFLVPFTREAELMSFRERVVLKNPSVVVIEP